jgi:hypothetical protein
LLSGTCQLPNAKLTHRCRGDKHGHDLLYLYAE